MSEKKEYIERGALIKRLNSLITTSDLFGMGVQSGFSHAIVEANAIPAADVEPVVRGEWVEHDDECECPVCGEMWNYCDNDTERFDFCPKCGARLVEHGKER